MTTVDSHHHLWPLDVIDRQPWRPADDAVLRRAFEPAEFERALDESGIDGSIVMQSVDAVDENARLAAYAKASDRILGWVGYADLPNARVAESHIADLMALRSTDGGDKLVGVRCLVGADAMTWTSEPSGLAALRAASAGSLTWDVVPITDEQVDAVCAVAEAVPDLRIVIDHLASPPMDAGGTVAWSRRIERLAAHRHVAIKLSVGVAVLQRWGEWDDEALRPYVDAALEHFGADRCMLASNWPVVLLRASHAQAWRGMRAALRSLDEPARTAVEGGTALRWYGVTA